MRGVPMGKHMLWLLSRRLINGIMTMGSDGTVDTRGRGGGCRRKEMKRR